MFNLAISKNLIRIKNVWTDMLSHWVVDYNEPQSETPSVDWYKRKLVCAGHDSPSVIIMHLAQRLCSIWQDFNIVNAQLNKANDKLKRIARLIDEWAVQKNDTTKEIINIISE